MDIKPVADDVKIWRKGAAVNPEIVELINQMKNWEVGKTFEVTLEKPVKSLRVILRREFASNKNINVKKMDDSSWYVRIDPRPVQVRKSKVKKAKGSSEGDIKEMKNIPEMTGQPASN